MKFSPIVCGLLLAVLSGFIALSPMEAHERERYEARGVYDSAISAVLYIRNVGEYDTTRSVGTGVIVSPDGMAMTAYHVVKNADRLEAVLPDGRILAGVKVKAYDEGKDAALLQLPKQREAYPSLPMRDTAVEYGEKVFAIGYPIKETPIITEGIINSPSAEINGRSRILTSAQIVSGMSGGPLIDEKGRMAGIVSGSLRTMQGIHLIVSMEDARELLNP